VNSGTFPACLEASRKAQIAYRHRGKLVSGYFSVEDTARLMQGFVPERSFTRDRRVIEMRIESALMVCGTPDQCYRQITEKWEPVFGKTSCSNNKLEQDEEKSSRFSWRVQIRLEL
jgi:hypothetical protein